MSHIARTAACLLFASAVVTMGAAIILQDRGGGGVSAQEVPPAAVQTAVPADTATPAATPTSAQPAPPQPTVSPSPACGGNQLSIDKVRASQAARRNPALAGVGFSDLGDGAIKVDAGGYELVIEGGYDQVGVLVPPGTPDGLVTALHLVIDEVRYAC